MSECGLSWARLVRALLILVATADFFHLLPVFSAISVGTIHLKTCHWTIR
ncbi:conserved hypothetical protein [Escherichia fergusonii ATCC 35469]|uniref:Uncharacterized protein n=1 Tax=Escherichia fergusonii (strain ATCC 35469 / DSM 13698 / CCUG 18766 / IAM 14443 / JCM 21226 / LMG 7866 / NBRC 102419 / NCTC 12128 / CDC 0568-73) TaxID=585054 RepID=B7LV59_ESCF3|nr:conserved hypothetical protein [Escherichia fergusonii ATCC 35469]